MSAPLFGQAERRARPGAGGGAGSIVTSKRRARIVGEVVGLEGRACVRRDGRLRMLAEQPLADGAPMRERDRRVGGGHRPDLGVQRGDPPAPVGQPGPVRRRPVALAPGRRSPG